MSGKVGGAVGGGSCPNKNGGPSNVKVELLSSTGDLVSSVLTSSTGSYSFTNIIPGLCSVGSYPINGQLFLTYLRTLPSKNRKTSLDHFVIILLHTSSKEWLVRHCHLVVVYLSSCFLCCLYYCGRKAHKVHITCSWV